MLFLSFPFPLLSSLPHLIALYRPKGRKSSTQTLREDAPSSQNSCYFSLYTQLAKTPCCLLFHMDRGFQHWQTCAMLSSPLPKIKIKQISLIHLLHTFSMAFFQVGDYVHSHHQLQKPQSKETRSFNSACRIHFSQTGCFLTTCCPYQMTFRIIWCTPSPVRHCRCKLCNPFKSLWRCKLIGLDSVLINVVVFFS